MHYRALLLLNALTLVAFVIYFWAIGPAVRAIVPAVAGDGGGRAEGRFAVRFADRAEECGVRFVHRQAAVLRHIGDTTGAGVALGDYDADGDLDILFANGPGGPPGLYRNDGSGPDGSPTFTNVTAAAGLAGIRVWGMAALFADVDGDGAPDAFITGLGRCLLLRNAGDGTFRDATDASGLAGEGWSAGAAFGDVDLDGDLDLYVARYVDLDPERLPGGEDVRSDRDEPAAFVPNAYRPLPDVLYLNDGTGRFLRAGAEWGIDDPRGKGLGVAIADFDDDGDPDIYVVNDVSENLLFRNDPSGRPEGGRTFREVSHLAGVDDPRSGMGLAWGDADGDGLLDVFATHWKDEVNVLYHAVRFQPSPAAAPRMVFEDATASAGLAGPSLGLVGWGVCFLDADLDGRPDIFVANGYTSPPRGEGPLCGGEPCRLFRNVGDLRFRDVSIASGEFFQREAPWRGLAVGDLDGDGDLDAVVTQNNGPAALLIREGRPEGRWLEVRLRGKGRNPDAVGARVTVWTGSRAQIAEVACGTSYLSDRGPRLHFGLGDARRVDRLRVRWPDGRVQDEGASPADRLILIEER